MNEPLNEALRRLRQVGAEEGRYALSPRTVLRLQQMLGNREVARLLAPRREIVELEARPPFGAALPALRAPGVAARVSLKARMAIVWERMTRGKGDRR